MGATSQAEEGVKPKLAFKAANSALGGTTDDFWESSDNANAVLPPATIEESQLAQNANQGDINQAKQQLAEVEQAVDAIAKETGTQVSTVAAKQAAAALDTANTKEEIAKAVTDTKAETAKAYDVAKMEEMKHLLASAMGMAYEAAQNIPQLGAVVLQAKGWMQNADGTGFDPKTHTLGMPTANHQFAHGLSVGGAIENSRGLT